MDEVFPHFFCGAARLTEWEKVDGPNRCVFCGFSRPDTGRSSRPSWPPTRPSIFLDMSRFPASANERLPQCIARSPSRHSFKVTPSMAPDSIARNRAARARRCPGAIRRAALLSSGPIARAKLIRRERHPQLTRIGRHQPPAAVPSSRTLCSRSGGGFSHYFGAQTSPTLPRSNRDRLRCMPRRNG